MKLGEWVVGILIGLPLLYVLYLFVSVVFLGGSSACPQNLC
jgi:hypothetical protein